MDYVLGISIVVKTFMIVLLTNVKDKGKEKKVMALVKIRLKETYRGTKVLPGGKYLRPGSTLSIDHEVWRNIQVDPDIEFVEEVVEVGEKTVAMIETAKLQAQHEKVIISKDEEILKLKRELETLKQRVIKQEEELSDPISVAATRIISAPWQKRLRMF